MIQSIWQNQNNQQTLYDRLSETQKQLHFDITRQLSFIENLLNNLKDDVRNPNYNQKDEKNQSLSGGLGVAFDTFKSIDTEFYQSLTQERGDWANEWGFTGTQLSSRSRLLPIIDNLQKELSLAQKWVESDLAWSCHNDNEFGNYKAAIHDIYIDMSDLRQKYITQNEDDL